MIKSGQNIRTPPIFPRFFPEAYEWTRILGGGEGASLYRGPKCGGELSKLTKR